MKLKMNTKKFRTGSFIHYGDHFKYLGINIVYKEGGNLITVGKSYKNAVAKRYLRYMNLQKDNSEFDAERFYEAKRIAGQISFVKQVEGMTGYWQITERVRRNTQGRVNITTDKIYFE